MPSLKKSFSINMHFQYIKVLIFGVLIVFTPNFQLFGQITVSENGRAASLKAIENIHDQGIVVKLYTQKKTIDLMMQKMQSNKSLKNSYEKKIKSILKERRHENEQMIKAFSEHFTMAKVYFIPDYNYEAFISGAQGAYFWDKDQLPVEVNIDKEKCVVLSREFNSRFDWKFTNHELNVIPNPFPNYFAIKPVYVQFFKGLFQPKAMHSEGDYIKLIQRIEKKLNKL